MTPPPPAANAFARWFWRAIGVFAFVLGVIGVVLPVWPTTVFWILAAIAFARSDPIWRDWLYARPRIGPRIQTFVETGRLDANAKSAALIGMSLAWAITAALFWGRWWIIAIAAAVIGAGALYVSTRPSPPPPQPPL